MFTLKLISRDAIPTALERAHRYRLLNEPMLAESICLDILQADPENEQALTTLLLALTDQFEAKQSAAVKSAMEILHRIRAPYMQMYYKGIICERQAKAQMNRHSPSSGHIAHELLTKAMACYEEAEAMHPSGNEEATLRWNTCARILMSHAELVPAPPETAQDMLE